MSVTASKFSAAAQSPLVGPLYHVPMAFAPDKKLATAGSRLLPPELAKKHGVNIDEEKPVYIDPERTILQVDGGLRLNGGQKEYMAGNVRVFGTNLFSTEGLSTGDFFELQEGTAPPRSIKEATDDAIAKATTSLQQSDLVVAGFRDQGDFDAAAKFFIGHNERYLSFLHGLKWNQAVINFLAKKKVEREDGKTVPIDLLQTTITEESGRQHQGYFVLNRAALRNEECVRERGAISAEEYRVACQTPKVAVKKPYMAIS